MLNNIKQQLAVVLIALFAGLIGGSAVISMYGARADQSERIVPTAGVYTGPQYAQLIGDMARSISTANKGSTAPANVSGSPVDGLEWLDDSATPWVMKRYINGTWVAYAAFDPSGTPSYIGFTGGGGLGSVASASVTNLASVNQTNVTITGTTTITSFGSSASTGAIKVIRFDNALTLTYSSALPTPCGYDLVTAANDRAVVTHLGSGNWEFTSYQRANGVPVDCSSVGKIEFGIFSSAPANHVIGYGQALTRTSYPAYLAAVTRAQNGTRTSGNATITSVANTAGLGAGMPIEGSGIQAGCTIASVTSSTIVMNSSACATSSGTGTVTVFLTGYGTSGTSSTVGVADCRNRTLAGRDVDTPGSFASRLTTSYFGADGKVFNVAGSSSESVTMALANLYEHRHSVFLNDPGHTHSGSFAAGGGTNNNNGGGGGSFGAFTVFASVASNTTGITVRDTSGGGGTANQTALTGSSSPTPMRTVQPTLIAECVVRVTP